MMLQQCNDLKTEHEYLKQYIDSFLTIEGYIFNIHE